MFIEYERHFYLGPCLVLVNDSNGKTRNVPIAHEAIDKGIESRMEGNVVGNLCIKITKKRLW